MLRPQYARRSAIAAGKSGMADEKDDPPSAAVQMPRVRRRAPTIDLKATEVAVESQPSAAPDSATPSPEPDNAVPPEYSTQPPAYETGGDSPAEEPAPSHEAAASDEPPSWPEHTAPRSSRTRPLLEAGLAGGLVALLVFGTLWLG